MRRPSFAAAIAAAVMTQSACGASPIHASCPAGEARDGAGACRPACASSTDCDDGAACNGLEVCQAGICYTGTPLLTPECRECMVAADCDDADPCTDDLCAAGRCRHPFNTAPCDDGVACTVGDSCVAGLCEPGIPTDGSCDDGVDCTTDLCDPLLGCVSEADHAACDDSFACTVDTCHPSADCQHTPVHSLCHDGITCTVDACDVAIGCTSTSDHDACDDDVACTTNTCDPTVGCVFPPDHAACDDGVGCTRDLCDARIGCRVEPDHSLCAAGECEIGTCDPQADCDLTPQPNLLECGSGGLCLVAECAASSNGVATRTEAPQCAPTTWLVKDLKYNPAEQAFLALVDFSAGEWNGSACSATAARTGLFRLDGTSYAAYGADLAGVGHAIADPFVLAEAGGTHVVGILNTGTDSIDWSNGNWMEAKLDALTGAGVLTRAALFNTGPILHLNATRHALFAGASSAMPSSGIAVHCTWTTSSVCLPPGPCLPNPSCSLTTTATDSTLVDIAAWTAIAGTSWQYTGSLAAANLAAGGRRILGDHIDRDWNLSTAARTETSGTFAGVVSTGVPGESLAYGSGAVVCRDWSSNGALTCETAPGPSSNRYYYAAASLPGGGVALLARSLCDGCVTTSYTLVTLRGDFAMNEAPWVEHHLSTRFLTNPAPIPHRVAAGGGVLLVVGADLTGAGPYYWRFAP